MVDPRFRTIGESRAAAGVGRARRSLPMARRRRQFTAELRAGVALAAVMAPYPVSGVPLRAIPAPFFRMHRLGRVGHFPIGHGEAQGVIGTPAADLHQEAAQRKPHATGRFETELRQPGSLMPFVARTRNGLSCSVIQDRNRFTWTIQATPFPGGTWAC